MDIVDAAMKEVARITDKAFAEQDATITALRARVEELEGAATTHQRTMDALREAEKALEAQIRAHGLLCRSAGLDAQAHADGTSQARAALTRIKGDVT